MFYRSDDAAIIGKLQQELMALTLSYKQCALKCQAGIMNVRGKEMKNRELLQANAEIQRASHVEKVHLQHKVIALQNVCTHHSPRVSCKTNSQFRESDTLPHAQYPGVGGAHGLGDWRHVFAAHRGFGQKHSQPSRDVQEKARYHHSLAG